MIYLRHKGSKHMSPRKNWSMRTNKTCLYIFLLIASFCYSTPAIAQMGVFQEKDGLVVIEAESVELVQNWVQESSEAGHVGNGYIRWNGENYFNDKTQGILSYKINITNPGVYNMRLRMSHQGAPAGDQENDCWTAMDDGPFLKTFHPGTRINEGFTFHSFHEPSHGEFTSPSYELSAGEHTFYIAARSRNLRIDRIHLYKNSVPEPESIAYPESVQEGGSGGGGSDGGDGGGGGQNPASISIDGEQKKWHPIQLTLTGPQASEGGNPNPFLDYRFEVTFSQGARSIKVPGYFAADGNAAETSATSGNKWRAHFVPDRTGTWNYTISMRQGADAAISDNPSAGTATQFDGLSGSFSVSETDKTGKDFRGKGTLRYVGEHYLKFDNGDYFIKGGTNSPENFLAFRDFDGTSNGGGTNYTKTYNPHVIDWQAGDPSWKAGKGKGIIGAINYLSSKGMNVIYFITMNVEGDGKDVWPWVSQSDRINFDVSKLDQWDIVFDHMDKKGMMLHVLTQETENELLLNGGALGRARKLYYRELIARFSHHHAITWNLGEENDENTDAQRKEFAAYFKQLDPYDHPVVIHTFPGQYDEVYTPLLGDPGFDGPSLQLKEKGVTYSETLKWRNRSANNGRKWVVSLDELGPYNEGVTPDGPGNNHGAVRKQALWGNLMAGGAGVEWYFGYDYDNHDLSAQDFRSRDNMWDYTRHAIEFFRSYLPFHTMAPNNQLTTNTNNMVLAKPGEIYAVYFPNGGTSQLNVEEGDYTVRWYNPRNGGSLQTGSVSNISGAGNFALGNPPNDSNSDWVALIRNSTAVETSRPEIRASPATLTFGQVQALASKDLPVTIENKGFDMLNVASMDITGPNPFPFTVTDTQAPFTLAPGESRIVTVRFEPGAAGNKDATLVVSSNDPGRGQLNISISGVSIEPTGDGGGDGGGTGGDGGGDGGGGTGGDGGGTGGDGGGGDGGGTGGDGGGGDGGGTGGDGGGGGTGGDGGGGDGGGTGGDGGGGDGGGTGGDGGGDGGGGTGNIPIAVTNFMLVDAKTGEEIMELEDGDLIDLSSLPSIYLNIRADTEPFEIGSVMFSLNENNNFQLENSAPYAMAGDIGDQYNSWTPVPGEHKLTARPFSSRNGTGVQGVEMEINFFVSLDGKFPKRIKLEQNYPNPFTSSTIIPFTLTQVGYTTLTIYDMLGREVARLVERDMPDGTFHETFNAESLPPGVYFYRLENRGETSVKKMIISH